MNQFLEVETRAEKSAREPCGLGEEGQLHLGQRVTGLPPHVEKDPSSV